MLYLAAERADAVKRVIAAMDERAKVTTTGLAVAKTKGLNLLEQREAFAQEVKLARQYIRTETRRRCKLLILDTLSAAAPDSDEGAQDFKEVVDMLRDLAEQCSMTVLVIHHEGKDDRRGPRGSGALEAGFDATIKVMPIADRSARYGTLQVRKQNGDLDDAPISYTVEKVDWAVNNLGRMTQVTLVGRRTATRAHTVRKPKSRYEPAIREIMGALLADSGKRKQLPRWARQHADYDDQLCVRREDVDAAIAAKFPGDAHNDRRKAIRQAVTSLVKEGAVLGGATSAKGESVLWPKGTWTAEEAGDDVDEA